jgi:hypothetical protein
MATSGPGFATRSHCLVDAGMSATIQKNSYSQTFAPTDAHNSLGVMWAPIAGCRGTGDTIGAALFIGGDESGPKLTTFITLRR